MGKDNIVFHSVIWPALLLGQNGAGDHGGTPGAFGTLNLPSEIVSSEFLTMSGSKFSTSRGTVIYVTTSCASSARTRCATSSRWPVRRTRTPTSPGRSSSGARTSSWPTSGATSVNRSVSMAHRNVGAIPKPTAPTDADAELLAASRTAFDTVGGLLARNRFKQAAGEAMRVVTLANRYLSDQEPWKRKDDPDRRDTILHTALQVVQDANTLLTPFLPHSAQQVHEALGGTGTWAAQPEVREVEDLGDGPAYPVLTGTTRGAGPVWASTPVENRAASRGQAVHDLHQARPRPRLERAPPGPPSPP
jgi:methionyl-tRNA synthetase